MCDSFQGNTRAYTWKTNSWTEVLARISFGRRVAAVALGKYRDEKRKLNELYASRSQKHDHDSLDSRNALRRIPEPTEQKFLKEASSPRGQHIQTRGEPEALLRQLQTYLQPRVRRVSGEPAENKPHSYDSPPDRIREGNPAAQVFSRSEVEHNGPRTRSQYRQHVRRDITRERTGTHSDALDSATPTRGHATGVIGSTNQWESKRS